MTQIENSSVVIISNGHNRFITGAAATEANRNGLLVGFLTAGYPTPRLRHWITLLRLDRYARIGRLLQRQELLPDSLVYSFWLSEIVHRVALGIAKHAPRFEDIADYGLRCYAWQAERIVRNLPAKIYHYRSGYGRGSVRIAKRNGMITFCDHSIAHPAALGNLIANGGKLPPPGHVGHVNKMWNNILEDVDQADYVLVNSDFVRETFIHFGYEPRRIFVLYVGVDDRFLSLVPRRTYVPLTANPVKLLFAGDMGARKGGWVLLQALSRIRDLPWQFEAIGSVDPDLRSDFRDLLADKRVSVTGYLPWAELAERMSLADIFVFPSLAEGSARVVFMALACGCYVITTPNSGSIVQDGANGRLVPPGDGEALANAIRETISMGRERIAEVGIRNARLIRDQYRQSHYGDKLVALYSQLLGESFHLKNRLERNSL